jgi:hypothetical protein
VHRQHTQPNLGWTQQQHQKPSRMMLLVMHCAFNAQCMYTYLENGAVRAKQQKACKHSPTACSAPQAPSTLLKALAAPQAQHQV